MRRNFQELLEKLIFNYRLHYFLTRASPKIEQRRRLFVVVIVFVAVVDIVVVAFIVVVVVIVVVVFVVVVVDVVKKCRFSLISPNSRPSLKGF